MTTPRHCAECGAIFEEDFRIPRSAKQQRAFYRMVNIAVDQWPESHEYQPEGVRKKEKVEHMRHWLLCQAEHRQLYGEPWDEDKLRSDPEEMVRYATAFMRAGRDRPTWAVRRGKKIYAVQSRSIAFDECSHEEFRVVFDKVQGLIEATLDIKIEFTSKERRELAQIGIER